MFRGRLLLGLVLVSTTLFGHELGTSRVKIEPNWRGALVAGKIKLQFQLYDKLTKKMISDEDLARSHEQLLHFFTIEENAGHFSHTHPTYDKKEEVWEVEVDLPHDGRYRLWAGGNLFRMEADEFAAAVNVTVKNGKPAFQKVKFLENRKAKHGKVEAELSTEVFREDDVSLPVFSVQENGKAARLKSYLGEVAHVIAISEDGKTFLHSHAGTFEDLKTDHHGASEDKLMAEARTALKKKDLSHLILQIEFPRAGNYHLWAEVVTESGYHLLPFRVKVLELLPPRVQEKDWVNTDSDYFPESIISTKEYKDLERAYAASRGKQQEADGVRELSLAIEKETLPALQKIFQHKNSVVSYETFTDPIVRKNADYQKSKDDAAGLRVVWSLFVPNPENPKDRKLIAVIFFFDYDFVKKRFVLISEEDAMRIRAGRYGVSYILRQDKDGNVISLEPGVYINNAGQTIDKRFTRKVIPNHCEMCHEHKATYLNYKQWDDAYDNNFEEMPGYVDFLKWFQAKEKDKGELEKVKAILQRPKLKLFPTGLIEAIRKRSAKKE